MQRQHSNIPTNEMLKIQCTIITSQVSLSTCRNRSKSKTSPGQPNPGNHYQKIIQRLQTHVKIPFIKAGRLDGHDGRSDGLGFHRILQSWCGTFEGVQTICERDCERSSRDLVLESLIASRPNGYESHPNTWLFSFHFAHEH
jgi:hypothetical protein